MRSPWDFALDDTKSTVEGSVCVCACVCVCVCEPVSREGGCLGTRVCGGLPPARVSCFISPSCSVAGLPQPPRRDTLDWVRRKHRLATSCHILDLVSASTSALGARPLLSLYSSCARFTSPCLVTLIIPSCSVVATTCPPAQSQSRLSWHPLFSPLLLVQASCTNHLGRPRSSTMFSPRTPP